MVRKKLHKKNAPRVKLSNSRDTAMKKVEKGVTNHHGWHREVNHVLLQKYLKILSMGIALAGVALTHSAHAENAPLAYTAMELERARLAEIVAGIDQLLNQVDVASRSGASGRIQFNYSALRRDLLGRRELIQRYINGAWDAPRDIAPLATHYNR